MAWTIVDRSFLNKLIEGFTLMAMNMDRMTQEVSENTDAVDAATALLETLADEIRANAGDATAMNDLADKLDANSNRLAAAVAANTPAQPEPEPAPTPGE